MNKIGYSFLLMKNYNQFTHLITNIIKYLLNHPAFINLGLMWNSGFAAFFFLIIQLITGFLLSTHYVGHADMAFVSVELIMRDVNFGWLLRYLHANGASFFFFCVYMHILRNLYYSSYYGPRKDTWLIGVVIFILLIATAFTGYVLPWGQMSFWAATVITNLFSAIPFFGKEIVHWLWGGFSVSSFTLTRFFSLHFILPFIISALVALHIIFLHVHGGNNKFQMFVPQDKIRFFPFYLIKDLYFMVFIFIVYLLFVGFAPNYLLHVDNYVQADPLVTPPHIVPEWYFLIFYAILRSIPSKVGGILTLLFSISILFILPYIKNLYIKSQDFHFDWFNKKFLFHNTINGFFKKYIIIDLEIISFWFFFVTCFLLGFIGSQPIEAPYLFIGRMLTIFYFIYFVLIYVLNKKTKIWN